MLNHQDYQGYFIDLDGTTYRGKERIPAAARFVARLQAAGKQVYFVTNNSTKTPESVATNLRQHHQINVSPEQVYTTALATADYLDRVAGPRRRVLVVGERGLRVALRARHFQLTKERPDYVVVGLDTAVTYPQLEEAVLAIRAGATFIGTNADSNLPNERGMTPGAGALIKLVEYATQQAPVMIGKPEKLIMELALGHAGLQREQVVMVGDNYRTDIQAGINVGMDTLLVYTGLSTRAQVALAPVAPTYQLASLDGWRLQ